MSRALVEFVRLHPSGMAYPEPMQDRLAKARQRMERVILGRFRYLNPTADNDDCGCWRMVYLGKPAGDMYNWWWIEVASGPLPNIIHSRGTREDAIRAGLSWLQWLTDNEDQVVEVEISTRFAPPLEER